MRQWLFAGLVAAGAALEAQVVRDSAGAKVRAYARGATAPTRWTVDPAPLVRIGGASGTGMSELAGVVAVARFTNGSILVANGSTAELRIFGADGSFTRVFGRKGRGPREFDNLMEVHRTGDTVFAVDAAQRVQAFTPDGTLLRTVNRQVMEGRNFTHDFGHLANGGTVLVGVDLPFDTVSRRPLAMADVELRREGAPPQRLAAIPAYQMARKAGRNMPLFLGPAARFVAEGDRACAGWTGNWQLTCWDATGRLLWVTRRDIAPRQVTEAEREAFREGHRRANRGAPPDRVEAAARAMEFADERSQFGRVELSTTGEVWVGEHLLREEMVFGRAGRPTPDGTVTWSVLGRDGRWIADVTLPKGFYLMDAGSDYVAGIERDADDVEGVVVYRLRR